MDGDVDKDPADDHCERAMALGLDPADTNREREAFGRHPARLQRVGGLQVDWFRRGAAEAVDRAFDVIGSEYRRRRRGRVEHEDRHLDPLDVAIGELLVPDLGRRKATSTSSMSKPALSIWQWKPNTSSPSGRSAGPSGLGSPGRSRSASTCSTRASGSIDPSPAGIEPGVGTDVVAD